MAVVITPRATSGAIVGPVRTTTGLDNPAADSLASIASENQTGTAFFGRGQALGKIENYVRGTQVRNHIIDYGQNDTSAGPSPATRWPQWLLQCPW